MRRLERREIRILFAAVLLVTGLVYYGGVIAPARERAERLDWLIAEREKDYRDMQALLETWNRFQRLKESAQTRLKEQGGSFTLLSFLEGISREVGISGNIQYMKPLNPEESFEGYQVQGMEIQLEEIHLDQLVRFLHRIEFSDRLCSIPRALIRRVEKDKKATIKVTLRIYAQASLS